MVEVTDAEWKRHEQELRDHRTVRGFTYSTAGSDGNRRTFRISGDPIFDEQGHFAGYRGVGSEVTALVQATESLRLFRALMDQLDDMIEVIDLDTWRFLGVNERCLLALGYSRTELLALRVPDVDIQALEGDRLRNLNQVHATGAFVFESVFRRKDGTEFPVEINMNLIHIDREYLVAVARDVSGRKAQEGRIQHLAYHDALTGLPNRTLMVDRLQLALAQVQRDGRQLGLMFLDLDRFKTINDTLGHLAGDSILKQAAQRLRTSMRESDTVARVGGDEFLILLPNLTQASDAQHLLLLQRRHEWARPC